MRLSWVELRDFRNHRLTKLDPMPDGLIVAVGPNGEGKTNLLEGIHFLYALGSPRTSTNAPLVRQGAEAAYTRGEFETENGRVLVEVEIPTQGASKVKVNRSPVRRKRDLRRQVRAVLFGPFDLPIVIGDPSKRRTFMDEAVIALWPLKEGLFSAYDRSLRQRNRLLKEWEGSGTPPGMEAWDEELIQAGSAVIQARAEAIDRLAPHASEEFVHLAGYELACTYAPNVWDAADLEQAYRDRIAERRRDELQRRTSLGRAAPRRPHAGRARPRREGRGLARRNVGHGAVPARRPRHRGHEGARGAAGVPGGRPVQRARSHAPRPDR